MPTGGLVRQDGGNAPGVCAEPHAAQSANGNGSPITGGDTRWRGSGGQSLSFHGDKRGRRPGSSLPDGPLSDVRRPWQCSGIRRSRQWMICHPVREPPKRSLFAFASTRPRSTLACFWVRAERPERCSLSTRSFPASALLTHCPRLIEYFCKHISTSGTPAIGDNTLPGLRAIRTGLTKSEASDCCYIHHRRSDLVRSNDTSA